MARQKPIGTFRASNRHSQILRTGVAVVLGADGQVLAARPGLPWPFDEAPGHIGGCVDNLAPSCLGHTLQRLLSESLGTGAPSTAELGLLSPEGEMRCLSLRIAPCPLRPDLWALTSRDTTSTYRVVENLLGELDRQRAEKISWQDAAQAIAHDVRSPLAALRGFLSLMAEETRHKLSEREREFLDSSLSIADRIDAVAGALLDSAQRAVPVPQTCDVAEVASRLFLDLRAAHPGVPFTWCVSGRCRRVGVSAPALWDILWNLAENSVRYRSDDRPLHLVLTAEDVAGEVRLAFEDNGRGLVDGEEQSVFERGWRGSNVSDTRGHGIGLYHVRKLVRTWGGNVAARRLSRGAGFALSLPVTVPGEQAAEGGA